MTRPTLKLPKKAEKTAAPPKAMTTRARDVQQQKGRSKQAAPAPAPAPAAKPKPESKPGQTRFSAEQKTGSVPVSVPVSMPRAPRPEPSQPDEPRLSKRMSELGLCSRREADEWIENGWVKVDGKVVSTLGVRVGRDAKIEVDQAAARHQGEKVTILLNKPVGYVSGQPEDGHQPAMVLIKPENHWPEDPSRIKFVHGHLRGLAPAGGAWANRAARAAFNRGRFWACAD